MPTLASVAWYFCFQMWLSMHSAPVIGLHAFPRFMSIDNNGGANSHAPCVVGASQALRSLRQALAFKRLLERVRERIDYTRSRSPQVAHVDCTSLLRKTSCLSDALTETATRACVLLIRTGRRESIR